DRLPEHPSARQPGRLPDLAVPDDAAPRHRFSEKAAATAGARRRGRGHDAGGGAGGRGWPSGDRRVAELPALQREALLLRYRDGLSYADIALIVGCPLGTVRTRLHHAKRRL